MEIIQLRSKTVDEVLPALLPLVEPGGTLTGMNDQLFLKASVRNRDEIKRVLAAMDKLQPAADHPYFAEPPGGGTAHAVARSAGR